MEIQNCLCWWINLIWDCNLKRLSTHSLSSVDFFKIRVFSCSLIMLIIQISIMCRPLSSDDLLLNKNWGSLRGNWLPLVCEWVCVNGWMNEDTYTVLVDCCQQMCMSVAHISSYVNVHFTLKCLILTQIIHMKVLKWACLHSVWMLRRVLQNHAALTDAIQCF